MVEKIVTLRCKCCGLPFARIVNGALIIESRHHGEKHENSVSIEEITLERESVGTAETAKLR